MRQHVRDGDIQPRHGGFTYEALALEAFEKCPPVFAAVEREQLQRSRRRLPMAPAGIMRIRGKR